LIACPPELHIARRRRWHGGRVYRLREAWVEIEVE